MAVCDRESAALRASLHDEAWSAAREHGELRLWEYNSELLRETGERRALFWTLVLSGVYSASVRIWKCPDDLPHDDRDLLGGADRAELDCPSGKLVLLDVEQAANGNWAPLAQIAPGRYVATVASDREQEAKHMMLEEISQYPPGDGPDFVVHLAPVTCPKW